ncbi:hypothetical protein V2J09_015694 [Rumex salicifolius]
MYVWYECINNSGPYAIMCVDNQIRTTGLINWICRFQACCGSGGATEQLQQKGNLRAAWIQHLREWDGVHFTDAANRLVSDHVVTAHFFNSLSATS